MLVISGLVAMLMLQGFGVNGVSVAWTGTRRRIAGADFCGNGDSRAAGAVLDFPLSKARERKRSLTMTTIQIELPDATAQAAREAGLLTAPALERLLNEAIRRRQAADALLSIADRVAAAGIPPMSMEEINAEVKAARAERKQRAGGH
jgi:hypothetical protein